MLVTVAALAACGGSGPEAASPESRARPVVAAVSYPLAYFAETIGGALVDVVFPVPADVDPAFWQPTPEEIAVYQQADVVLANGAGYASWLRTASLPMSRFVDTSQAFADQLIETDDAVLHSHGPEGDHSHGMTAFTTWLDPTLAIEHARAVCVALEALLPEARDELRGRLAEIEALLADIDARQAAASDSEVPVLGSHPVYQYLARRYALDLVSLHWEPDVEPDEKAWAELDELLVEHPARAMLWESEPLSAVSVMLAERGIASHVYAPMGNRPDEGDLLQGWERNYGSLTQAFGR